MISHEPLRPATTVFAHGVALACLAAAVFVRWLLDPVLGDTHPLTTLFAAIGGAVWIGGYRPALLVAGLGYLSCHYLFIRPRGELDLSEPRHLVGFFLFLATAATIIIFGEALHRARRRYRIGEEAERRRAELMRTTLSSIGDGVITTDIDGRITSMNAVAERLTGWTNAEAAGLPLTRVLRIVDESTRQEAGNPALRALRDGVIAGSGSGAILLAKDGAERPIDDRAAPIRSGRGEITGSVLVFRDISERRRAEAGRRAARDQIAKTLESVTDGLIRYDRDWRIIYVNAEAERINRLTRADMLGRILWEVFPVLAGTEFEAEFRRAVADRVTIEFENFYEPFGRWYSLKGYPTDDGGLTTFIRDITEPKFHFEALRRSEARLRRVFESNVVGMIRWDLERSLILEANDTFLRKTGYTRDDVAAGRLNFRDMTPGEWTPRNEKGIRDIQETGYATPYEKEYFRKDGSRISFIIAGTRFEDSPSEGMSILIDISESKRAEKEIVRLAAESERQRRLYETVLTNTPDFVYVFSLDHKVVYANAALLKMWGRDQDGAIGRTFLEIGYEPWHAEMHDREIDQVRATRRPIRGEVPFNGTDGRRIYDYIFVPVIGADGEVEAVAGTTRDVTERKASEAEREQLLRRVEEERGRLANVFHQAPAFMCVLRGPDHVYELANDRYFTLVGPRDILGKTVREALPEVEEQGFISFLDGVFRTGEPFIGTGVRVLLDQIGERFIDFVYQALRDPDGGVTGVVAVGVDVTARHQAEEALRLSEERSAFVRRSSGVGFWYCDLPFDVLQWDELVKSHFHLPPDATVTIQTFYDRLHPDDREPTRLAIERSIAARTPYNVHYRTVDPDTGVVTWIRAIGRTAYSADGAPTRFDGVTLDVSDQKRAEASLKESEERFRLMADAAPVMIWLSATDRKVFWYNQPWLTFTGRTMEEEVGHRATEVVHPDDRNRALRTYSAAFDSQEPFSMEYRLRRHDGEFRWMICNGVPRYRADGGFDGYIGSCLDVTDYKNAQAALREADRRKDEFLATLAHELRNPLAPIRNGLQIIRMAGVDDTLEETRSMMERQLEQMVRLVDDLLDVSRVTTGKLRLRMEPVELRAVIDTAVETTRPVIEEAGHELAVVVPDDVIFVDGDATRLAQVVSNLLNNSAKYTHRGGHIRLTVHRDEGMAVVVVADDGIGIPPWMVGRIFEMFIQVDRALEKTTGGLGIGLSLVKGLVEMHGGTVSARSGGEGRGSEFIVRLPFALSAPRKLEPSAASTVDETAGALRRRILVADDNVDSAKSLGRLLELRGNEVRTANDGLQTVETAEAFRPDIIFLDIGMPKLNGYEVCRHIREQSWGRRVILVAMTGWGQEEDKRRSHEAGFDHHLVKPVAFETIRKLLSSLKAESA